MTKALLYFGFLFLPVSVLAQQSCLDGGAISATGLCNPTPFSDFSALISSVMKFFGIAVGLQAIIAVVFAGFKMIISQGNSEEVETAKAALQWALLGMLLIFCSFALVYATSVFIGASDVNTNIDNPIRDNVTNPVRANSFLVFLESLLTNFLTIAGLIALLMIMVNGFRYITAGGNNEQTESAKSGLQWAVIGLIVIALAYTIVQATAKLLPG
jgi:cytochrome bd-type quinol oxidase subunit 2